MNAEAHLEDIGDRSGIQARYEEIFLERKATLGEADRSTLSAMHDLGALFKDMGEHVKGLDHVISCYKQRVQLFGPEDRDSLASQQYLGEYYRELNRAADGIEYLQGCYNARSKVSEDSEETLDAMRALGKCYLAVGMTGEALNMLEKRYNAVVKQTLAQELSGEHPRTLACRLDYADALISSGCCATVSDLHLQDIMKSQRSMHGASDPQTLKLMEQYAELCGKLGDHDQALALNTEAVEAKTATLGANHTSTIKSKFAVAASLIEVGRTTEVQQLNLEDCLKELESRLGETHPSVISSKVKLAALYNIMGKYEHALALFQTCYEVRCESLGKDHELTLGVANNIAAVYDALQRYQESQDMYESTLTILQTRLGKAHLATTAVLLNLGMVYQRRGNLSKALELYTETYNLCLEAYGEKHPRTLLAYDSIGCIAQIEERWQDAVDIYTKNMDLKAGLYAESHPLCLTNLENLASCKQRLGFKAESIPLYQKLVKLRETGYGVRHIDTIKARAGMAIVLAELDEADEAMSVMEACVRDATEVLGAADPQVLEYIGVIGYIHAICGQWDEAIHNTDIALSGTIKLYGEDHFLVDSLLQRKAWMQTNKDAAEVPDTEGDAGADDNAAADDTAAVDECSSEMPDYTR